MLYKTERVCVDAGERTKEELPKKDEVVSLVDVEDVRWKKEGHESHRVRQQYLDGKEEEME